MAKFSNIKNPGSESFKAFKDKIEETEHQIVNRHLEERMFKEAWNEKKVDKNATYCDTANPTM